MSTTLFKSAVSGYAGTLTLTPSGVDVGDVLIAAINFANEPASTVGAPSGWTVVYSQAGIGWLGWKVATSSDVGASYTWASSGYTGGGIAVYSTGFTSPVDVTGYVLSGNTQYPAPSVTTTQAADLVVCMWCAYDNTTWQPPSGITSEYQSVDLLVSDFVQTSAGATPTQSLAVGAEYGPILTIALFSAEPPNAPTLLDPPNTSYQDASSGVTFTATYNSTDEADQNAYAARIKTSGSTAYSYYNASTNALQSTIIWNPVTTAPSANWSWTIPAAAVGNGNTYNWSAASQESLANLQGSFAPDFTFNAQSGPAINIIAPGGSVTTATPQLTYTATPASGSSVTGGRWLVYPVTTTQASGFSIDISSGTIPSGAVSDVSWSGNPLTVGLQSGVTLGQSGFVAYAAITETGGQWSSTVSSPFTVTYDEPAQPSITATASTDPTTGCPLIAVQLNGHDNLLSLVDASFEGSVGTWTGSNCVLAVSSAEALDGSDSMSMQIEASGAASASSGTYPVVASTSYVALAAFRPVSALESVQTEVEWFDGSTSLSTVTVGGVEQAGAWVVVPSVFAAPSTATEASVVADVEGGNGQLVTPAAPTVTAQGNAALAAPGSPAVTTATTGGSIAASVTRYYEVTAVNDNGQTLGSTEVSVTTGSSTSTNANTFTWASVSGAASYDVYIGTSSGGETLQSSGITGTSYTDTAASLASGAALPSSNTTAGATTYDYSVAVSNVYGSTPASSSTQITNGNATLGSSTGNTVTWTAVPLAAGSSGNLVYDSNLTNAIAAVGPTWSVSGTVGTANGDVNVLNAGTDTAEWVYYGTGSAAGTITGSSATLDVTTGSTYTLAAVVNATDVTTGSVTLIASAPGEGTAYATLTQAAGANGSVSASFTVPSGVTQLAVYWDTNDATVTAGDTISWSQIQLTETSTVQTYEPGPLPTYTVYARSGTLTELGTTTALGMEDTGQTLGAAVPPTTDTTGEAHYVDCAGIFPGDTLGYQLEVLSDGPSVYFPLTDAAGSTTVYNAVGSGDGTVNGGVTFGQPGFIASDPSQTAALFDGTSGYINIGDGYNFLGAVTVEAFVRTTGTGVQFPVLKNSSYGLAINKGVFEGYLNAYISSGVTVNDGKLHHIAFTWDGSTVSTYVDGVAGASGTAVAPFSNTNPLQISAQNLYASGDIAHVAIYPSALSAARIQAHYNAALNTTGQIVQKWTRGGLAGITTATVTRSDGIYLRGASQANPATIPTPSQQVTINDYEVTPTVAYTYTAQIQANI